jgi:hypothetical protein
MGGQRYGAKCSRRSHPSPLPGSCALQRPPSSPTRWAFSFCPCSSSCEGSRWSQNGRAWDRGACRVPRHERARWHHRARSNAGPRGVTPRRRPRAARGDATAPWVAGTDWGRRTRQNARAPPRTDRTQVHVRRRVALTAPATLNNAAVAKLSESLNAATWRQPTWRLRRAVVSRSIGPCPTRTAIIVWASGSSLARRCWPRCSASRAAKKSS